MAREYAVGLQEVVRDEYSFLLPVACSMAICSEMRLLMRPVRGRILMSFSSGERVDMLILPVLIYCSEWVPMPQRLRPLLGPPSLVLGLVPWRGHSSFPGLYLVERGP